MKSKENTVTTAKSILLAIALVTASAIGSSAQVIDAKRKPQPEISKPDAARDYNELVREVFAPVTDRLNLTNEQKLRIVSIVSGTVLMAEPLFDQLDQLDDQLSTAVLLEVLDEAKIQQLSDREGRVMSQIIGMKARAKAGIYRVLTPDQRALVVNSAAATKQIEGSLGSISNY
jgi:Spy/CpxP family protein refolding chaperone